MVQTQIPVNCCQPATVQESSSFKSVFPPVDIFENQDSVVIIADIPGVEKDQLNISVENRVLTLNAKSKENNPEDTVYQEFHPANYYRQFNLSERVNAEAISAELKNGVLTLNVPKAEEAKPKRIDVQIN